VFCPNRPAPSEEELCVLKDKLWMKDMLGLDQYQLCVYLLQKARAKSGIMTHFAVSYRVYICHGKRKFLLLNMFAMIPEPVTNFLGPLPELTKSKRVCRLFQKPSSRVIVNAQLCFDYVFLEDEIIEVGFVRDQQFSSEEPLNNGEPLNSD
jgi:hypothetical protein